MYIVSMTTIPSRKGRLKDLINIILKQSWQGFEKFCINIDDNLSKEDYEFYDMLKEIDNRIEINICDHKWRSCNKLLPTIKKYPDAVVITVDDDIDYPIDSLKTLVEAYEQNPDCIITHETNPIIVINGQFVGYSNNLDLKLDQKYFAKYLSNCCLFPPHVFDNTDLFDYDKMMQCTDGTHDELWFWINSTINGVQCIGLDYIYMFTGLENVYSDGYKLSNINSDQNIVNWYNAKTIKMYGDKINKVVGNEKVKFHITKNNIFSLIYHWHIFKRYYANNSILNVHDLTPKYKELLKNFSKNN